MITARPIIYKKNLRKDGTCNVIILVTYNREKRYYKTKIEVTPILFERVMTAKRRTTDENNIHKKIEAYITKANNVIDTLPIFTFNLFEAGYLTDKSAVNSLESAFDKYIEYLQANDQIGTAIGYNTAKNCFAIHWPKLKFADVTPTKLKHFEKSLLNEGKSNTTISMYVRCLRSLFNFNNIPLNLQPFHRSNNKSGYKIPLVTNQKKALTVLQIASIYNYEVPAVSTNTPIKQKEYSKQLQRAKDYWIFMFLCNGMNINDLCNLTWQQINGNLITYHRQKTQGKSNTQNPIQVSLKDEALEIIRRQGTPSVLPTAFVFPHYKQGQSTLDKKKIVNLLTKSVNKYLAIISKELKITPTVTTQYARHSFATVLKRANASTEFISEALGHNSLKTTKHYLASFEAKQVHTTTDVLTDILRKQA